MTRDSRTYNNELSEIQLVKSESTHIKHRKTTSNNSKIQNPTAYPQMHTIQYSSYLILGTRTASSNKTGEGKGIVQLAISVIRPQVYHIPVTITHI